PLVRSEDQFSERSQKSLPGFSLPHVTTVEEHARSGRHEVRHDCVRIFHIIFASLRLIRELSAKDESRRFPLPPSEPMGGKAELANEADRVVIERKRISKNRKVLPSASRTLQHLRRKKLVMHDPDGIVAEVPLLAKLGALLE